MQKSSDRTVAEKIEDNSSQNSSSENSNTTSSKPSDETSSKVENGGDSTSLDNVTSKPIKNDDGSIELPFDEW